MERSVFLKAISVAKCGTEIMYHRGLLMFDRQFNAVARETANAAWKAAGMRWDELHGQWRDTGDKTCALVQRRVIAGVCEYIAVKL
jgi:hypothetical protein